MRICQLEEENARLRQETEALRSLPEQGQIREEQVYMDTPSSIGSVGSRRSSPEASRTSTPLLLGRGHNITSNDLDAIETNKVDFHGPTSAIFDGQHPATREATVTSQVDVFVKTQLLAEAAKQRRLLLRVFMTVRIVTLIHPRSTRAHQFPLQQISLS